jgi:hypothetical protein
MTVTPGSRREALGARERVPILGVIVRERPWLDVVLPAPAGVRGVADEEHGPAGRVGEKREAPGARRYVSAKHGIMSLTKTVALEAWVQQKQQRGWRGCASS